MGGRADEFAEYFAARFDSARRIAYALCGNWTEAEEISQTAFVKLYTAWHRVRPETIDAYLRTILTRTFLDGRRRGRGRTRSMADVPDSEVPAEAERVDEREALLAALRAVPPRQRAVLVLRYLQDLSVEQTAATMRCSVGTVKGQTARGLDALRGAYPRYPEHAQPGLSGAAIPPVTAVRPALVDALNEVLPGDTVTVTFSSWLHDYQRTGTPLAEVVARIDDHGSARSRWRCGPTAEPRWPTPTSRRARTRCASRPSGEPVPTVRSCNWIRRTGRPGRRATRRPGPTPAVATSTRSPWTVATAPAARRRPSSPTAGCRSPRRSWARSPSGWRPSAEGVAVGGSDTRILNGGLTLSIPENMAASTP
jgi:RNA polymerase sigma-70 factor (sigma-E family)